MKAHAWIGWHTDYTNDQTRVCSCGCNNGYYDYYDRTWVCPRCRGEE